jgi:hypothetical protein
LHEQAGSEIARARRIVLAGAAFRRERALTRPEIPKPKHQGNPEAPISNQRCISLEAICWNLIGLWKLGFGLSRFDGTHLRIMMRRFVS